TVSRTARRSLLTPPAPRSPCPCASAALPVERRGYTIAEFGAAYGVSRTTIWREIKARRLRVIRFGRRIIIPLASAEQQRASADDRPPRRPQGGFCTRGPVDPPGDASTEWQIINLLKSNGIRGTFCVNGRCAELYPDAVAQIVKSGHDVAGHAYLQD